MSAPQPALDPRYQQTHASGEKDPPGGSGFGPDAFPHFPQIYLSGLSWDQSFHPLDLLARLLMLLVYGTAGLPDRTRSELRVSALMLSVVFCFEVAAWTFVFRQFATWTSRDSFLIYAAALMVAMAMTMLERSIIVSDMTARGWSWLGTWLLVGCRIAIIIFVAFKITSQPVELIAFNKSIDDRIFQEDVRRNLVNATVLATSKLKTLESEAVVISDFDKDSQDEVTRRDPRRGMMRSRLGTIQAQQQIDRQDQAISSLNGQVAAETELLRKASKDRERTESLLEKATRQNSTGQNNDTVKALKATLATDDRRVADLNQQIINLNKSIRFAGEVKKQSGDQKDRFAANYQAKFGRDINAPGGGEGSIPIEQRFDDLWKEYFEYVSQLQTANSPAGIHPHDPFSFQRREYDDVERLVLVENFRDGVPPFQPELAPKNQTEGKDKQIETPRQRDIMATFEKASAQLNSQGDQDAKRLQRVATGRYWMILGIAVVVPMVALIYKVTSGKELKNYFSVAYQANSLHPEALFQATTEQAMRYEKDHRLHAGSAGARAGSIK